MRKTILKNFHRPFQFPACFNPAGILRDSKTVSYDIRFRSGCAYNLDSPKQRDWNKLFGLCFGFLGVHKESVRFGWRYNEAKGLIEICTIVYHNGKPVREYIENCDMTVNDICRFTITADRHNDNTVWCSFTVNGTTVRTVCMGEPPKPYFGCGLYFGGTSRAPHRMQVEMKKNAC